MKPPEVSKEARLFFIHLGVIESVLDNLPIHHWIEAAVWETFSRQLGTEAEQQGLRLIMERAESGENLVSQIEYVAGMWNEKKGLFA